ncbi:hypothetical protein [Zunongwangia atlantica]|uniref:Uncharacterized protein n=1 Tax=Zunongwangia atlantica 22II14-10F7 TaxID=1185767 RepID=A0A1Y1T476_9FLAO|nr:hypothetical protein [Zunongwangia atlantica]ORL45375.1 hypothetical protein IIF7_11153 [Zunongwangia atlantica 22II14-10F7]
MNKEQEDSFWRGVAGHNDGSLEGQMGWDSSWEKNRIEQQERDRHYEKERRIREQKEAEAKAQQEREAQIKRQKAAKKPKPAVKKPSVKTSTSNGWQSLIGFAGFIVPAIYVFNLNSDNTEGLILGAIVGVICGYIAYKLYQLIIFILIGIIAVYLYTLYKQNN